MSAVFQTSFQHFKHLFFIIFISTTVYADAHLFVYHRFGDAKHASTNISLENLRQQFNYLKTHHYKVVSLKQLKKALKEKQEIPDNWVIFTIDDSYKSFYENGLALFKEFNYPFTLFVYVEATEKHYGDFMSWEQIKQTQAFGEIGLHSYGHKHMVSLSTEDIKLDTQKALASFEKNLGYKPHYYAYPYGEFDNHVKKVITSFGFDLVLNQNVGAVSHQSPHDDLDRIALTGDVNLKHKLRIKYLDAKWHSPKNYPTNAKLNEIHVTMPPSIHKAELYVSGGGWEAIKISKGTFKTTKEYSLRLNRTRVIIKHGNAYTSKIIVKK